MHERCSREAAPLRSRTPARVARLAGLLAVSLGLCACASFSPPLRGPYRADDGSEPEGPRPLAVLVGDIGKRSIGAVAVAREIGRRLAPAPEAPVVVLGDVFYSAGLLGTCPASGSRSQRGCTAPGTPEAQLDSVTAEYREAPAANRLIAIAGNHDHYGGPEGIANACRLWPAAGPGWQYLAWGCGLGEDRPVEIVEREGLTLIAIDSERMIQDPDFRRSAARALGEAVSRARRERPQAWIGVVAHHPLETYGSHNGAHPATALAKDLYWLRTTVLLPVSLLVHHVIVPWLGHQDLYQLRYRAFRRAMYEVLAAAPVDFVASGHDHSLQLVRIEHPGVRNQIVSGAGGMKSPVKRFGLDFLWTNRLARAVGLESWLPAPRHTLLFGAGGAQRPERTGYGYAVLSASNAGLFVSFYDGGLESPLYSAKLADPRHP